MKTRCLPRTLAGAGVLIAISACSVLQHAAAPLPLPAQGPPRLAHATLPVKAASYLGVFEPQSPQSYNEVSQFATAIGHEPNLALYFSGWLVPFKSAFADEAWTNGAVPAIQMDPETGTCHPGPCHGISLAKIAAGKYDAYLRSYAAAVARYGHPVVIGFGHEMNGWWFHWGYRHTSPAAFVAAWRHVVSVFRQQGAYNVTWLWTINIIDKGGGILAPRAWWPGSSYVTWVGIDGYYRKLSWKFVSLFGPTIKAVRALTLDPILIAETGAAVTVGQPSKITDLFAGISAYGLLGFVWFDVDGKSDWRISSPAAVAAFRQGAKTFDRPSS
jgi:mannan endo-1,4-beta-mannosidase